jgi:alkyl hydroperoxide reductase subunit AhpC
MPLRINDEAPNFTAQTTQGVINFHEWIGDGWAILFSHPKDFTPVCTTELGYLAGLEPEFAKRKTKIIGLSVDPVSSHGKWARRLLRRSVIFYSGASHGKADPSRCVSAGIKRPHFARFCC